MVHALGNIQDVPPSITVHEQQVSTVEEFVYLGALNSLYNSKAH